MMPDEIHEILQALPLDEIGIPARFSNALRALKDMKPGFSGDCCEFVLQNMGVLEKGKMLILSGPMGCGKTLAAYLAVTLYVAPRTRREIPERTKYNRQTLEDDVFPACMVYRGVEDCAMIVNAREVLKAAFDKMWDRYARFQGLLMIDDLGREHFTDKGFGISEWDYLFDARYADLCPTIITTNMNAQEFIDKYNRRIYDRLRECAIWKEFSGSSLRKKA